VQIFRGIAALKFFSAMVERKKASCTIHERLAIRKKQSVEKGSHEKNGQGYFKSSRACRTSRADRTR